MEDGPNPFRGQRTSQAEPIKSRLFGVFELIVEGRKVCDLSRPAQQLFALLALAGSTGRSRAELSEALWPEASTERGMFYLRRALSQLRKALGGQRDRLSADTDRTIRIDLNGCDCDATRFQAFVRRSDSAGLEDAVELNAAQFLIGHNSEWIQPIRADFREQLLKAFLELAGQASAERNFECAVAWLEQAMQLDPLREATSRELMIALARKGDFPAIARRYRELQTRLRSELGLSPSSETIELYRSLLAYARLVATEAEPRTSVAVKPRPLPVAMTSFVGRAAEQRDLAQALLNHRLVTLSGVAGVGKTRLAVAVARGVESRYAGGVVWIDLSEFGEASSIDSMVESALASVVSLEDSHQSLSKAVQDRPVLLLIDGAERFVDECATVVRDLLASYRGLTVLCTSRRPLRIDGGFVMQVLPFPAPSANVEPGSLLESDAIKLFLERARAAAPRFQMSEQSAADVARVCKELDGLPLALELAAVRLRHLTASELAAGLKDRFQLLGSGSDRHERHSTLRAALDWSHDILDPREQRLFRRLAIFPGSWTLAAATGVCADSSLPSSDVPGLLSRLVEHSLVEFDSDLAVGRYRMIESVRAYAQEKLRSSHELGAMERSLGEHYLVVAERMDLAPETSAAGLDELSQDDHNLIAAIEGLLTRPESIYKAIRLINRLYPYWYQTLRLTQGFAISSRAIDLAGPDEFDELVEVLFRTGSAAYSLFKLSEADELLKRAERLADRLELESWSTESLRFRGALETDRGHLKEARELTTEALERSRAAGDQVSIASCLGGLGYIARQAGDLELSRDLSQQAMALHTAIGDTSGRLWCLGSLGAVLMEMGDLPGASCVLWEALAHHRGSGNLWAQAWNLTMLGEVSVRAAAPRSAVGHVDEALSIHSTEEQGLARIWPLRVKGEALRQLGELDAAERVLQEALSLSRASGATSQEAYALVRLSMLKLSQGDPVSAKGYHDAAKIIADRAVIADLDREVELNEARIESALKNGPGRQVADHSVLGH